MITHHYIQTVDNEASYEPSPLAPTDALQIEQIISSVAMVAILFSSVTILTFHDFRFEISNFIN